MSDPAQPILDLPARLGTAAADLAHAIAPACFALMITGVVLLMGLRLVRSMI